MKNFRGRQYIYQMFVLFGALALAICMFFVLFYMDNIRAAVGKLLRILMPFIYGAVIAYILKPVCNVLERWFVKIFTRKGRITSAAALRLAGPFSVFSSIAIGILIVAALLMMVIPQVFGSLSGLVTLIQDNLESFESWIVKYVGNQSIITNYVSNISEGLSDKLGVWIQQEVLPQLQTLVTGVTSGVASLVTICSNLFIGLIVAVYLLGSRKKFAIQSQLVLCSIFKEKWTRIIIDEVKYADKMFGGFINGKLLDSAIIGVICFIFTWMTGMPYGVLVSVIVGVTNIIPFFGPYLGAVPSALLILMVSPAKCIVFIIFIIILQQFDGNILGPKILGNVTGLSSFWVLFAILTFGGIFGFIGMIVGVPVFAVIYDIIKKLVRRGLSHQEKNDRALKCPDKTPENKISQ